MDNIQYNCLKTECSICGGKNFSGQKVIWPELAAQWQLSDVEVSYVDKQQGCACDSCGANLRIVALADAVRRAFGTRLPLQAFVATPEAAKLRVLDINGAMAISSALAKLPLYVRGDFPAVDMHALPFSDETFDLVIHSDTLEHVERPVRALEECRKSPRGRRMSLLYRSDHRGSVDAQPCWPWQELSWRSVSLLRGLSRPYGIWGGRVVFCDGGGILPSGYQSGELSGRYRVNRLAHSSRGSNSMSVYDQDGLRSVHKPRIHDRPCVGWRLIGLCFNLREDREITAKPSAMTGRSRTAGKAVRQDRPPGLRAGPPSFAATFFRLVCPVTR